MALEAVRRLRGAEIRFEPFIPYGEDDSLKGQEFRDKGASRPEFRLETIPLELRSASLCERSRIEVRLETSKREELLDSWTDEAGGFEILAEGAEASTDGIYRVQSGRLPDLRIRGNVGRTVEEVHWRVLKPSAEAFNLWPDDLGGKAFSKDATPWIGEMPKEFAVTRDPASRRPTWAKELDAKTGWGRLRIEAEVVSGGSRLRVPAIELRVGEGAGFRRALTEPFGMPWVSSELGW